MRRPRPARRTLRGLRLACLAALWGGLSVSCFGGGRAEPLDRRCRG